MPVRVQKLIAFVSVAIFIGKIIAWRFTHSVAILTDALESIINVVTGFIGLYSIILAVKPRDRNHPFGHGKIEYVSASIEGVLILIAGLIISFEAVYKLIFPQPLQALELGIILTTCTGIINYVLGSYALQQATRQPSATLDAAGRHLRVDAYSTFAIIAGLLLLQWTHWWWIDSAVALLFAVFIIITGYKVLRKSLSGIMDESDEVVVKKVIQYLEQHRLPQWIDIHNMRVLQYGAVLHIDAHMTLPWYYTVADGEKEIHRLEQLVRSYFGNDVEMFIHIDACASYSCKICSVAFCPVRQSPLQAPIQWTPENMWIDAKHGKSANP